MSAQNTSSPPAMPIVGQSAVYRVAGVPLSSERVRKPLPQEVDLAQRRFNIQRLFCCGIIEVSGLSYYRNTGKDSLLGLTLLNLFNTTGAILFTDASYEDEDYDDEYDEYERVVEWPVYGTQLKAAIEEAKLGTVTVSEAFYNHNSGNYVRAYLWVPDSHAVRAWLKANHPDLLKYYNGDRPVEYES